MEQIMTGKVKMYNKGKGYGFITGQDGEDYFFHVSEVSSAEVLFRDINVTFRPGENSRGKIAYNISIMQGENRPAFISLGNVRIKLSNIKNYGISICNSYYYKVYEFDSELAKRIAEESSKKRGLFRAMSNFFSDRPYEWRGKKIYIASFSKEVALKRAGIDPYDAHDYSPRSYRQEPDGTLERDYFDDFLEVKEKYLYISTYQDDNFQFPEGAVDFNIFDKCKEIDSYML